MKQTRAILVILSSIAAAVALFLWPFSPGETPEWATEGGHVAPLHPLAANHPVEVETAEPEPVQAQTISPALEDRFAQATEFSRTEQAVGPALVERIRIVSLPGEERLVRVVEQMRQSQMDEGEQLVRQEAMVADQVLVGADSVDLPSLREAAEALGFAPADGDWVPGLLVLELPEVGPDAVPAAIAALDLALQGAAVIEPNYLHFAMRSPNDDQLWRQWGLDRIDARGAWTYATGSSDVVVAVIDSGVDLSHPDLVPNLHPRSFDFQSRTFTPQDQNNHGTHIAGVIGAVGNNGVGVAGVNWDVSILALRVGDSTFPTNLIIEALDYAIRQKRDHGDNIVVTNNSYGTTSSSLLLRQAIERTRDAGILFVAAAGNDGTNMDTQAPTYPASYTTSNIISVASTTTEDALSGFSNYSNRFIHLAAPGSSVYSTLRNGSYGNMSGTSMAAPFVAGAVALMAAADPALTPAEIKERLLATVDPVPALSGKTITGGRLNLGRAMRLTVAAAHSLRITSPASPAVELTDASHLLRLEATIDDEAPAAVVQWEALRGGESVTIYTRDDGTAWARFNAGGDYVLRASTVIDGLRIESDRLLIRVGDSAPIGLGGHWPMDDGAGMAVVDVSGLARHGTLRGNASWTDGRAGGGLQFDGRNARADFEAPTSHEVTLSAWVRSSSRGESIFPRIIEGPEHYLFFGRDEAGPEAANRGTIKFFANRSITGGVWYSAPYSVGDGEWVHVAATYDGSSTANAPRIYLNGRLLPVQVQVAPSGSRSSTGTAWSIGDNRANTRPWHGQIDEVKMFQRVLDPEEVFALSVSALRRTAPALSTDGPTHAVAGSPVVFSAIFAANSAVPVDWAFVAGPGHASLIPGEAGTVAALFSTPGYYTLRAEATADGLRVGREVFVHVLPADGDGSISLMAARSETLRNPAFPVEVSIRAATPAAHDRQIGLTVSGDAQPGFDYEALPASIFLPAGESEAAILLKPISRESAGEATVRLEIAGADAVEISLKPYSFAGWQSYYAAGGAGAIAEASESARLLQYALGASGAEALLPGHPHLPRAAVRPGDESFLSFTYVRPAGVRDVRYEVETFEADAGRWVTVEVEESIRSLSGGLEEVTVRDTMSSETLPMRLLRLRVTAAPIAVAGS